MQRTLRKRVPLVTGLLTVVSLALVIAAARQSIPAAVLPTLPEWLLAAIPHVNAVISVVAIGTITLGIRWIRRGEVRRHRSAMLTSFGLFVTFLALYLLKVAIEGPSGFTGPGWVELSVYYPTLVVHMLLAILTIPLVYYVLLLAVTHAPAELSETNHPRVGRVAAAMWLVSFALGIVVYLLLYVVYPG